MAMCKSCGKKAFFLKTDDLGLCVGCHTRREADIGAARPFLRKLSDAFDAIKNNGGRRGSERFHLESLTPENLSEIKRSCGLILAELPRWSEYPGFDGAFLEECVATSGPSGYIEHPNIDIGSFSGNRPLDFAEKINRLLEDIETLRIKAITSKPRESALFRVVGVTFKNDRKSRQAILRKIRFRDPPYSKTPEFRIEKQEFEGEPSFAVYANEEQVGNISKKDISDILPRWDRYREVSDFEISGGGDYNYGLTVRVSFLK